MRKRKSAPTLTAQQRRRQIIGLLSIHLARMPEAIDVSPPKAELSVDFEHESAQQNLCQDSQIGLELSAN